LPAPASLPVGLPAALSSPLWSMRSSAIWNASPMLRA